MPGDIDLGSGNSYWGANLTAFVDNGLIAESRVTDMAERIVTPARSRTGGTHVQDVGDAHAVRYSWKFW